MKFNGGIIIVGSLIWDSSKKRAVWRDKYLNQENLIYIKLPIRYGRISTSRMNTYTMNYSANLNPEEFGQGIILKFKNIINSYESLREILEDTIRVEKDKTQTEWKFLKQGEAFTLNWSWGVLGVSINPKYISDQDEISDEILPIVNFWKKNLSDFNPQKFSIKDEKLIINEEGQFKFEWTKEIEDLDFIISTIVEPRPDTSKGLYPTPKEIAEKMYEGNYYAYFMKNIESGIKTNDDPAIIELIKSDYNVVKYIEQKIKKETDT